jgi:hypothetical protein
MSTSTVTNPAPQQLALLTDDTLPLQALPLQFRLDQHTRARGLAHVAAIKAQLAARAAARADQASPTAGRRAA